MKTSLLTIALLGAGALQAAPIYLNTTTDTFDTLFYSVGPYTQIGDQVAFAGTARSGNTAVVQFFNNGTGSGTFSATLRFFAVGAPVGAQIGSSFLTTGTSIGSGATANVSFNLGGLLLPDNVVFTVAISSVAVGLDLGLDLFNPPTLGSSSTSFFIVNNGAAFSTGSLGTGHDNFYFSVDASGAGVPEPATLSLMLLAVPALAFMRRRSKS